MAVAAVFLILFSACYTIVSLVKFFAWRRKTVTTGMLVELKDTKAEYKSVNSKSVSFTKYIYNMKIPERDKYVRFEEKVDGEKPSKFRVNDSIDVCYDPTNMTVISVQSLKQEILKGVLGVVLGVIILALCFFIV
ncbi:MAG: hypothetical protein IJC88_03050 [Oscillospiraceae bacterium]|nr:hypothetical protein [Oscillospiraceae bacterium]